MIRYKRLGYVALNVTDLDRSVAFYCDQLGLTDCGDATDEYRFLRVSGQHHDIVLFRSDKPGLKRVGFELEHEQSLTELRESLDAQGIRYGDIPAADAEAMRTQGGVRTAEPVTGTVMDFYISMQASRDGPFVPTVAQIQRLGHFVINSIDYKKTVKFFTEVLNFKVSDRIEERVTFMRCFPNPLHHSLGVSSGMGGNKFVHVAFMVSELDDIGKAIYRFQKAGVPIMNGPGRHKPSGSIFLYFLDPDGLTVEYTFGMEEFEEVDAREPRELPAAPETIDLWLGPVDPRKAKVGHIEPGSVPSSVRGNAEGDQQ
jgi:2,3-dihydroxy-p-cumate/2,3-dihydroxybenzoate 3,4-dioxygenase